MSDVTTPQKRSPAGRQADKVAERRRQLATSALQTLAELGYARTSLRDIAQNSEFSHGVLHYYFDDKVDLLTYCVRRYEDVCVTRYDEIVAEAETADGLRTGFAETMAATLQVDAPMHRLWYDVRNQSLFDEAFRSDVREIDLRREAMIWNVVRRYAELSDAEPNLDPAAAYGILDGLFQQALLRHLFGDDGALDRLRAEVERVLDTMIS